MPGAAAVVCAVASALIKRNRTDQAGRTVGCTIPNENYMKSIENSKTPVKSSKTPVKLGASAPDPAVKMGANV